MESPGAFAFCFFDSIFPAALKMDEAILVSEIADTKSQMMGQGR